MSPDTVVVVERVRVRHDSSVEPGLTDKTNTATHCMDASSVNNRVPFCVFVLAGKIGPEVVCERTKACMD